MSRYFTPKHVEKYFHVTLTPRYRAFLTTKEWKQYEGHWASVPTYGEPIRAHFVGPMLESLFHDDWPEDEPGYGHPHASEAELGGERGWVPLATLGDEEPQYLVVKANDDLCPVAMVEHESGKLVECAPSLDAFLAALGKKQASAKSSERVDVATLSKTAERGIALVDTRRTKERQKQLEAVLAALEPMLSRLPSPASLASTPFATTPSRALYAKAKMLEALGRYETCCDFLESTTLDGKKVMLAPETLCKLSLYELDRPARVVHCCESLEREGKDVNPILRGFWALALFRQGDIDGAAKHLRLVIERQVTAATRLSPKKDPAKERAVRLDAARKLAAEYATKHGLDAQSFLRELGAPSS